MFSTCDSKTSEEEITRQAAAAETIAENMRRQSVEGRVRGTSGEKAAEEHAGTEDCYEEGDDEGQDAEDVDDDGEEEDDYGENDDESNQQMHT